MMHLLLPDAIVVTGNIFLILGTSQFYVIYKPVWQIRRVCPIVMLLVRYLELRQGLKHCFGYLSTSHWPAFLPSEIFTLAVYSKAASRIHIQ
jgi:hypothetical protein